MPPFGYARQYLEKTMTIPLSYGLNEEIADFSCQFLKRGDSAQVRYSFPVLRSGKSSSELSSLMVRNPMVGNGLEHTVGLIEHQ
jgi:hypothetical protein